MKTERTCPRCGKTYTDSPAMSRVGLGDICPVCGQREAFEAMGMEPEKIEELVAEIQEKKRQQYELRWIEEMWS